MSFKGIKGQDAAVSFLKRSLHYQRLSHAFLFTGPEGVGKKTTAMALAQAMNCLQPIEEDACGECSSCRKIEQKSHPDVHWIMPEGQSIKIDQIRDLWQREINLRPAEGRIKFFILDQSETLTLEAANSILKTLEEPPADVVIILITIQPFSLLPTIRSRCQEIRFHALPESVIVPWLQNRIGCSNQEARTWARLSGGSAREALSFAGPEGQTLRNQVLELIGRLQPNSWPVLAVQIAEWRSELSEVLQLLLGWFRDLLILASGGNVALICNLDQLSRLQQEVRAETVENLGRKCEAILKSMDQVKMNLNIQLMLENLMMELGKPALSGNGQPGAIPAVNV